MLCANPTLEDQSVALEYKVDGMLAALYLITVGIGPDPISPFVLLAASTDDITSMYLPEEFLIGTIPDEPTALGVREVLNFKPNDMIPMREVGTSRLAILATEHVGAKVLGHPDIMSTMYDCWLYRYRGSPNRGRKSNMKRYKSKC